MFIVMQKEQGIPAQRTGNELVLGQVDAPYQTARDNEPERVKRDRGIQHLAQGLGFTDIGVVLTVPLALFFGAFSVFGIVLFGFGIFRLVQGVRETRATQGVKS